MHHSNAAEPNGFKTFCDVTSLAGFKHIGSGTGRGLWGRLFWSLTVLCAVGLSLLLCERSAHQFFNASVVTTIGTTTANLSNVYFPSVTVCNPNVVQRSFLDHLNLTSDASRIFSREFFEVETTERLSNKDKAVVDAIVGSEKYLKEFRAFAQVYGYTEAQMKTLEEKGFFTPLMAVSNVGTQFRPGEMVLWAKYQGQSLVGSVAAVAGSDFGMCASLNPYDFGHTAGFYSSSPSPLPSEVKAGAVSGVANRMELLLDAEVYDYAQSNIPGQGLKVAVHHFRDMAVVRQSNVNVSPGTQTNIGVIPTLTRTESAAVSRFGPDRRDCYVDSEVQLAHWWNNFTVSLDPTKRGVDGRYSMSNCLMEAVLQKTASECKCAPSSNLLGFDLRVTPVCSGASATCFNKRTDEHGQLGTIVDREVTKPCLASCNDQEYRFEVSSMAIPNRQTFIHKPTKRSLLESSYPFICGLVEAHVNASSLNNASLALKDTLRDYISENVAWVAVFIRDPYVTVLVRNEAVNPVDFVGNLGGLAGLCVGFSVISVVEVVYFCFGYVISACCGRKVAPASQ